ncbi:MAG: MFS transporter [Spongiibacteraceae bacterium]|nr:MFS transporter [Spongiibacteraceae bacterium]
MGSPVVPQASVQSTPADWQPRTVYSLGFLTLIATFNYLDRSIIGLAIPAIKAEMQVSDTALGLVSGLAFILFYSVMGIPIAWAADRWSRRNIIAIGFAFWSFMTMATGWVTNIWQLAMTRFLMGAGEACGIAPSNSIISDLFRSERRTLAFAIFGTAASISSLVFFPIMGWIGQLYGWRQMFVAAGLPGVVLALVFVLTVKEPQRGAVEKRKQPAERRSFRQTIAFLMRSRAYICLLAGATFMGLNVFGASVWVPAFLERVHGYQMGEIASLIGPLRGICGFAGVLLGGFAMDWLGRKAHPKWRMTLPALACLLTGPLEVIFLLANSQWVWMPAFAASAFLTLIHQPAVFAAVVAVAQVRMRALATSVLLFCSALLGQAVGPFMVGAVNDLLAPVYGDMAIRYSMLAVAATAVLGGCMLWLAGRYMAADIARTDAHA